MHPVNGVLVVDDHPDPRRVLLRLLQLSGYEVQSAGDGAEALDLILASPPAVVTLDVMMPGSGGREILATSG